MEEYTQEILIKSLVCVRHEVGISVFIVLFSTTNPLYLLLTICE